MKFIWVFLVLLFFPLVSAYECIDFESKTVQHSLDQLFCVSYENRLMPMQMQGQYNITIEDDVLTSKYDHKIVFDTKGVLLLKAPDNRIMTVEVIDPLEREQYGKMMAVLEAQDLELTSREDRITELAGLYQTEQDDHRDTRGLLSDAQGIIDSNLTVPSDKVEITRAELRRFGKDIALEMKDKPTSVWVYFFVGTGLFGSGVFAMAMKYYFKDNNQGGT